MTSTSRATREFRADIQGLRGIAVLVVVLYHAGLPGLPGGFVGVDVFFVISGYLITRHLMTQLEGPGVRLSSFYARRIRRLVPAAWVVVFLTVLAATIWMPRQALPDVLRDAGATLAYVPNLLFASVGTDYFAEDSLVSLFTHYWSLGVEEQFYLLWPLILLGLWRLNRRRSRWILLGSLLALTALSFGLGFWWTRVDETLAFFLLPSRAWELGVGAMLAVVLLKFPELRLPARLNAALVWSGLLLLAAVVVLVDSAMPWPGWRAALPVLATATIIFAGSHIPPHAALAARPLQFLGKISYSLYLVHWPLLVLPAQALLLEGALPTRFGLVVAAGAVPLAWLLWRFVEEPARAPSAWWSRRPSRPILVAVAGFGLAALLAFPVASWVKTIPISSAAPAPPLSVASLPEGTAFVPSNLRPSLTASPEDKSHIFDDGCNVHQTDTAMRGCTYGSNAAAPLIVLFGDSHAAHWFPALERLALEGAIRLELHTKNSCSPAYEKVTFNSSTRPTCNTWRNDVVDRINEIRPDAVVIGSFSQRRVLEFDDYSAALQTVLNRIDPQIEKFFIADSPEQAKLPAACLATHVDDALACATPRPRALAAEAADAERRAARETGTRFVDLNSSLCDDVCPLIFGDTLAYRDKSHLTETFVEQLTPIFRTVLEPVLRP